jgi:undecaprenyl-phosphate 4-deoxy-4-formamido-L-arabinose transferase
VVPVYNGERSLDELIRRLEPVLEGETVRYEVILVDDDSRDGSWERIRELARARPWVRGMRLTRNYGQHNALLLGIQQSRGDRIVTLDDDLQHPPEEVPRLLNALHEDVDVVYGTPEHEQHGFLRDLASRITKLALQSAMGAETARKVSAFRVFRAELRETFTGYGSPFVSIDVLLTWATTRFASVSVRHEPRREGVSNYTFGKLVAHALNMITGFSVLPLQLASLTGFVFTLFGGIALVYVLVRTFVEGSPVPGFPFLASIVAIFSGAQLFALGIIGEYLARMHFRTMGRPPYAIRSRTDSTGPE